MTDLLSRSVRAALLVRGFSFREDGEPDVRFSWQDYGNEDDGWARLGLDGHGNYFVIGRQWVVDVLWGRRTVWGRFSSSSWGDDPDRHFGLLEFAGFLVPAVLAELVCSAMEPGQVDLMAALGEDPRLWGEEQLSEWLEENSSILGGEWEEVARELEFGDLTSMILGVLREMIPLPSREEMDSEAVSALLEQSSLGRDDSWVLVAMHDDLEENGYRGPSVLTGLDRLREGEFLAYGKALPRISPDRIEAAALEDLVRGIRPDLLEEGSAVRVVRRGGEGPWWWARALLL